MSVRALALAATLLCGVAAPALAQSPPSGSPPILGFTPQGAEAEHALESRLDAAVSPQELDSWLLRMASHPNEVGSPHDRENAEWQLAQFKSWGWDAHIETFDVLYPTPIAESVDLLGLVPYHAKLQEPDVAGDQTPAIQPYVLPPYLAYQGDGDVTAPLVYVNYGMPDDYRQLARQGVDVRGKIVIARYGGGWRGLKPKLAQEHGAVGCIIYSDPKDDGYWTNDVYPKGPQRPPEGVQRGSVVDITRYSGDPLTPGVAATPDAKRLTRETAPTLMKIPAIPMSYADALPFLQALGGPLAEPSFRGALPITYHLGPSPVMVHLLVKSDWSLKPLYDVIAVMKGSEYPDQWIVRGNHHDGWVFGAEDPLSGQVALMAEAKGMGELAKAGWRPKRTLVYASWDGEEPGLLGSTEWAEAHADDLQSKAVLYLNSDNIDRGMVYAEGSHELQTLANQAERDVIDPETGVPLQARARAGVEVEALTASGPRADEIKREAKAAESGGELLIGALGSGSDYTPFLQHLGVPSMDLGFGGEGESGGVYHSAYDTHDHYVRFGDPGMKYSATLAKTAGRIALRYADAELPPVDFPDFASTVAEYVDQVQKLADHEREETAKRDRALDSGAYKLAADPMKVDLPPERLSEVPAIDFGPLQRASAKLTASADRFQALYASPTLDSAQKMRLGMAVQGIDLTLMREQGLPGRPWYRHMIYAPGLETGYGVKTLPAVREAIEGRKWAELPTDIAATAAVLNAYADRLDKASAAAGG
jgi:N-acetylated-alpha-linked acidic dipeptidase